MDHINPRVDLAFKKIFGVEENKDLLISLINAVVSSEDQVKDVTLLHPYNAKNLKNDKLSILDIKAEGSNGRKFNIEIQISDEDDYDQRALFYWAKMYTDQLKSGEDYGKLNKAIGIHILNFISIPETEEYHNTFKIKETTSNIEYFKDLELHTIELRKFMKTAGDELSSVMARVQSKVDLWAAFLTKYDLLNRDNLSGTLDDPNLKKALDVLEVMNFNSAEREEYEAHLKWMRIEANTIKKATRDAKEEGREEGIRAVAKNLLNSGMSIESIALATGLTIDDISILK